MDMIYDLILRNKKKREEQECLYSGSYVFNRKEYFIEIFENAVRISRKVKGSIFTFNKKNAEDAVRKAYILYALTTGKGLEIKEYFLGKRENGSVPDKEYKAYNEESQLPFVVSMLKDNMLIHNKQEGQCGGIFGNQAIMDYVVKAKRSNYQSDKKMIALFAYLISRSREYEMDRFMNQWTAINAIYDQIVGEYKELLSKSINEIMESAAVNDRITKKRKTDLMELPDSDNKKIFFILRFMEYSKKLRIGKNDSKSDRNRELGTIDNTYQDYFKYFISAKKYDEGKRVFYDCGGIEKVCLDQGWEEYNWDDVDTQRAYESLRDRAKGADNTLYAFMTFTLPYHIRNDYVHGSMTSLIFSDAYNVNKLAIANYFMDSLITQMLPVLFDEAGFERLLREIHTYHFSRMDKKLKQDQKSKDVSVRDKAQRVLADRKLLYDLIDKKDSSLSWLKKSLQ